MQSLLDHYASARGTRLETEGRAWYGEARDVCECIAAYHGASLETVAGIVAALSPRMPWARNLQEADTLLATGECKGLSKNVDKAKRILAGNDPLDVLNGPKTRAFYRALIGDSDAIVLDVWMFRALGHGKDNATPKQYDTLAEIVRNASLEVGEKPADFQAIVWCAIRGRSA